MSELKDILSKLRAHCKKLTDICDELEVCDEEIQHLRALIKDYLPTKENN